MIKDGGDLVQQSLLWLLSSHKKTGFARGPPLKGIPEQAPDFSGIPIL